MKKSSKRAWAEFFVHPGCHQYALIFEYITIFDWPDVGPSTARQGHAYVCNRRLSRRDGVGYLGLE